jgi:multisubunit Na+/H+ antiporter MnhB subunit
MTEQQVSVILTHLRILIVLLGIAVGILLALAWEYLF